MRACMQAWFRVVQCRRLNSRSLAFFARKQLQRSRASLVARWCAFVCEKKRLRHAGVLPPRDRMEAYEAACMVAIQQAKPQPDPPQAPLFQTVKSTSGEVQVYLPKEYADEAFAIALKAAQHAMRPC